LAGAAGPDDSQQAALAEREADIVKDHLAARQLDPQVARHQRDVAGVDELLQFVADEPVAGAADADDVALGDRSGQDALAVDERAVEAVQVDDLELALAHPAQLSVVAGHAQVAHDNVIARLTADAQRLGRQRANRARPPLAGDGRAREHLPVARMPEAQLADTGNLDPPDAVGSEERPVRAAKVFKQPPVLFHPQYRVPPGNARVVHGGVRPRARDESAVSTKTCSLRPRADRTGTMASYAKGVPSALRPAARCGSTDSRLCRAGYK
jgi:hypothetical protein